MPYFHSLPPFQFDNTDTRREERYHDDIPFTPPITYFQAYDDEFSYSDLHPAVSTEQLTTYPKPVVRTEQLRSVPQPVRDVSTTQSLITALQATMNTSPRRTLVIPGAIKRAKGQQARSAPVKRLHLRLRYGVILSGLLAVIITTLVSLTPLGAGQNGSLFINGVISWVQNPNQNGNIVGHGNNAAQAGGLPAMTLPRSEYIAIARQDAVDAGINPDYFVRQINQESGFRPNAVSPSGAVGIAQFLPSTAAGLGIDPWNPIDALRGAARLMANYARQYNGDYAKALAAYNAGGGTLQNAINQGGANWMNFLPAETRNYIRIIMGI